MWRPFYTSQWTDARDVAEYVHTHYVSLRDNTQAFHDALFGSSLPSYVLDAVSANLAILKRDVLRLFTRGDRRATYEFPVGYPLKVSWRRVKKRYADMLKYFPRLEGVAIERAWTGYTNVLPDMLPAIGPCGPRGHYYIGFAGHGFALSPGAGKVLADLIADGEAPIDLTPFAPERFKEMKQAPVRRYR